MLIKEYVFVIFMIYGKPHCSIGFHRDVNELDSLLDNNYSWK